MSEQKTATLAGLEQELGQMRWVSSSEGDGWDLAVEAVRKRINEMLSGTLKSLADQAKVSIAIKQDDDDQWLVYIAGLANGLPHMVTGYTLSLALAAAIEWLEKLLKLQ